MTPANIDRKVITQRAAWIREMMGALGELPLKKQKEFYSEQAQRCCRRVLSETIP
jgi:hypothetical protein